MTLPQRVHDRMVSGLKRLLPIIQQQKDRDVSEADTVTLVKDLMSEVFGYDKYAELTSEYAIRGTYVDLGIRVQEKLVELVEVKAIGATLDDRHVKQAVDYAANQGVEWVILTNAAVWRLYQVIFAKPIDRRLLIEIDLTACDLRSQESIDRLASFTKEGFAKGAHLELRDQQDATSRFMLAALLLNNEAVISAIRRELRKVVDVLVDESAILQVLRDEVIKRDIQEGPNAEQALRRLARAGRTKRLAHSDQEIAAAQTPAEAKPAAPLEPPAPLAAGATVEIDVASAPQASAP